MALTKITEPFAVFTDSNGSPLDAGFIYIGVVDQNPETNPQTVYYDAALTQAAAQPLRTSNGYVMRNGSPATLYIDADYSLTVRDSNSALIITVQSDSGTSPGTRLLAENNLSDVANAATSRSNLGIEVGVDVAPIASPALTGVPTAPTAAAGTSTTQIATTAFVQAALPTEGTWTPTVKANGLPPVDIPVTSSAGYYSRVGNVVTVMGKCEITSAQSLSAILIYGLPFNHDATYINTPCLLNLTLGDFSAHTVINSYTTNSGGEPILRLRDSIAFTAGDEMQFQFSYVTDDA